MLLQLDPTDIPQGTFTVPRCFRRDGGVMIEDELVRIPPAPPLIRLLLFPSSSPFTCYFALLLCLLPSPCFSSRSPLMIVQLVQQIRNGTVKSE